MKTIRHKIDEALKVRLPAHQSWALRSSLGITNQQAFERKRPMLEMMSNELTFAGFLIGSTLKFWNNRDLTDSYYNKGWTDGIRVSAERRQEAYEDYIVSLYADRRVGEAEENYLPF